MRERALVRAFALAFVLLAATLFAPACKGKGASTSETGASGASPANVPVVSDSSEGLLFTWIDEKGEFHIQEKTAEVPVAARDRARGRPYELRRQSPGAHLRGRPAHRGP
jgi:hypothetical protein